MEVCWVVGVEDCHTRKERSFAMTERFCWVSQRTLNPNLRRMARVLCFAMTGSQDGEPALRVLGALQPGVLTPGVRGYLYS